MTNTEKQNRYRRAARILIRSAAVWMLVIAVLAAASATVSGFVVSLVCVGFAVVLFTETRRPEYQPTRDDR